MLDPFVPGAQPDPWHLNPPAGVMFEMPPDGVAPTEPPDGGAAEPWSLSQDEWTDFQARQEELMNAVGTLAQLEQQRASVYQPPAAAEGGVPRPDPWERPDTFHQDLDAYIESRLQPFAQTQQTVNESQWSETIADVMEDVASRGGDFDRDLAGAFAFQMLQGEIARAGGDKMRGLETTIEKAAQMARDFEKKFGEAAVARYTNQVATLADNPGEPGTSYSQGVTTRIVPDYRKDGGSVVERFFASNGAQ